MDKEKMITHVFSMWNHENIKELTRFDLINVSNFIFIKISNFYLIFCMRNQEFVCIIVT